MFFFQVSYSILVICPFFYPKYCESPSYRFNYWLNQSTCTTYSITLLQQIVSHMLSKELCSKNKHIFCYRSHLHSTVSVTPSPPPTLLHWLSVYMTISKFFAKIKKNLHFFFSVKMCLECLMYYCINTRQINHYPNPKFMPQRQN